MPPLPTLPDLGDPAAAANIAISLSMIAVFAATRLVAERLLRRGGDPIEARRRRFTFRAVANALLAVCLLGVWLSEIQNLVFSLAAVMVALVIATKELIMCVAGAFLRFGGRLFKVGDRIEVLGLAGEVVDHGLFSTTIMEIPSAEHGHGATGRRVTLPNSLLLAGPVRVGAQPRQFAPHRFTITLEHPVPVAAAMARLAARAEAVLAADRERAARFHRLTIAKAGVEIAGPGASVALGTSDLGKLQFHVMLYCLASEAAALQNAVTAGFLAEIFSAEAAPVEAGRSSKITDAWSEIARRLREPALSNAA